MGVVSGVELFGRDFVVELVMYVLWLVVVDVMVIGGVVVVGVWGWVGNVVGVVVSLVG